MNGTSIQRRSDQAKDTKVWVFCSLSIYPGGEHVGAKDLSLMGLHAGIL